MQRQFLKGQQMKFCEKDPVMMRNGCPERSVRKNYGSNEASQARQQLGAPMIAILFRELWWFDLVLMGSNYLDGDVEESASRMRNLGWWFKSRVVCFMESLMKICAKFVQNCSNLEKPNTS